MTPSQAAYTAGCIVSEIDARFGLTPTAINNASNLPSRLPVILRHVWAKAMKVPEIADLLEDWECPDRPFSEFEKYSFHIGYYHQRTARSMPESFGPKLAALRDQSTMTVEELARRADISRHAIYAYEQGKRRPTWEAVQKLAAALGVTTDTFRDA